MSTRGLLTGCITNALLTVVCLLIKQVEPACVFAGAATTYAIVAWSQAK